MSLSWPGLLQGALAIWVLWRVVRGVRWLCFEAPLPRTPWWRVVEPRLREGGVLPSCWSGWDRSGEAWVARLLGAWVAGGGEGLAARHEQLDARACHAAEGLGTLARVAHLLGVALAFVELASAMAPVRGIEGLAAGRLEREAIRGAMGAVGAGVATAWFAGTAHRLLSRQRNRLREDLRWVRTRLDERGASKRFEGERGRGVAKEHGEKVPCLLG